MLSGRVRQEGGAGCLCVTPHGFPMLSGRVRQEGWAGCLCVTPHGFPIRLGCPWTWQHHCLFQRPVSHLENTDPSARRSWGLGERMTEDASLGVTVVSGEMVGESV